MDFGISIGGIQVKEYRLTNTQYKILTVLLLFIFPPVGIALLCSKRSILPLIGKILIITANVFYFLFILILMIYSI